MGLDDAVAYLNQSGGGSISRQGTSTSSNDASIAEGVQRELDRVAEQRTNLDERKRKQLLEYENLIQNDLNAQKNDLERQRQELEEMKEAMRLEKMELDLKSQLQQIELNKYKSDDMKRTTEENESLAEQLEIMKAQNQMLNSRMLARESEAQKILDEERKQRQIEMLHLEKVNQKLTQDMIEAQRSADMQLAQERTELKASMKKMEAEKSDLLAHIAATEEAARQESVVMEMQRNEFLEHQQKMETEKKKLLQQMDENKQQIEKASEAAKEELATEAARLAARMAEMETEKASLTENLAKTEQEAQLSKQALEKKLHTEKAQLAEKLESMQKEKVDLANSVVEAERKAKAESEAVAVQLAREKSALRLNLERLAQEKTDLEDKMKANDEAVELQEPKRGDSAESREAMEALVSERQKLQQKFDEMANERAELADQLKTTEEAATEREKMMEERMTQEREELRSNVQRMKEEMMEERKKNESLQTDKGTSLKASLTSKKSLYDMMGDAAAEAQPSAKSDLDKKSLVPRDIDVIEEEHDGDEAEAPPTTEAKAPPVEIPPELAGLPAPHTAAAMGNLEKLKSLAELEPTLLFSFDIAHRSPLFYAVAYSQVDITSYLLDANPELVDTVDAHGDTILHAAASTGSDTCLELVILQLEHKYGDNKADMSAKNQMGMTPAHLAQNAACLQLLYEHGGDMGVLDNNRRSPLFIACAMDRIDCAEYLIECLDHDETAIYAQDIRGDTPLHASACNGAVDCLLMLLQYGIDPRTTNKKGLKAIDLAVRNKQNKCRELLAEYHLHYCTSSAFDSVLFLATLEGHKHVKHNISNPRDGENKYEIIKVNPDEEEMSINSATDKTLHSVKSMFSLKANKSLRLQRWGSWIAYEDTTPDGSEKIYWYNHRTNEGQWEKPDSVEKLMNASKGELKNLAAKTSMRLKRVGDWIQYMTEQGQTFYYNEKNGEFQWVSPGSGDQPPIESSPDKKKKEKKEKSDWKPYKDPDTGGVFWYNSKTKVSQWECPFVPPEGTEAQEEETRKPKKTLSANNTKENPFTLDDDSVGSSNKGSFPGLGFEKEAEKKEEEEQEEGVIEVHDDDDLGI
jgi:ankyrin repeat protein